MATDNPSLIISVSAFGFGDSVVINEHQYAQQALTPTVIIEDPCQKLFLYGERALQERTGSGFALKDDYSCCTLVSVLWQQLKACTDITQKQAAADRIHKYVIQLICDLKPLLGAESDEQLKACAPLLNRSDLRAKAQIVLLIPDNFTEVEQQCLLNSFLGYNLRLLWRSVAALMGTVATNDCELFKLIRGNRVFNTSHTTSEQEPRTLVQVLYVGADSIDLSSYELKFDQNSNYIVPVRQQAVYKDCGLGLNYLQFAISAAHYYARTVTNNIYEVSRSGKREQVEHSLVQQLFNQSPNIWGIDQDITQTVLKVEQDDLVKWVQLTNFRGNVRYKQPLNHFDIQNFYQNFGLKPQLPSMPAAANLNHSYSTTQSSTHIMQPGTTRSYGAMRPKLALSSQATTRASTTESSFLEQLANTIQNKLAASSAAYCFIVGSDQLVQSNIVFEHLQQLLEQNTLLTRKLQFQVLPAKSLSQGGFIFQKRLNQKLTTYLDRLPKLSLLIINEVDNAYQECILINEDEIDPQSEVKSEPRKFKIAQYAKGIELYVSSDPNFNDQSIEKATDTSFKAQGISVKQAKLPFSEGAQAVKDEIVLVSAMQKPLSGYVKIKITPDAKSLVLPPYGITRDFDPVKSKDVEDCLPKLPKAYPPLPTPNKGNWLPDNISLRKVTERNTIFSSSNKGSTLVYYNGQFATGFKSRVLQQLKSDYNQFYLHINELNKLTSNWEKLTITNKLKVLTTFSNVLDECLPITWYAPSEWPYCTDIASLIQPMLYAAFTTDIRRAHKLLRQYIIFVPDNPNDVLTCCKFLIHLKGNVPFNYNHMVVLKVLLENHPYCFNPRSSEFCMTSDFARLLTDSSKTILRASLDEVVASEMIKLKRVTGTKKLSISLVILMYSLMYRRKDRNYLANQTELDAIEDLLNQVEVNYNREARKINRICLDDYFNNRVNDFVQNKLKKLIPQVIDYLKKRGTNSDIMSDINDLLDGEEDKD